ncbi:hypothetical protein F0L68_16015 [Solihabitans fulvus]|uniref:Uncharacterized protein n=1 Tax=Solihabitans fulvus TaxID=1892852 RepID=A0A5B2XEQ2_9PSEU|nr:hypothetical protein [Solihabitans fulvus]KAA2261584.1 hypothetical protein F0L68_16015 [Solihabitans fulvus]
MELAELLDRTGLDVLDHLERQVAVPVVDGVQAQGDLIVIPLAMLGTVTMWSPTPWRQVPPGGVELVRGIAGNNPHTLVADPHTCRWTTSLRDPIGLGIAVFENTEPAYLVHPEHGGSGVAPGCWLVRRQQERGTGLRARTVLIAD